MLSVPIKVETQAAYNVLSVKHLAKILGGLLYAATSAVPWAFLPKTDVRARRDGLRDCGGRLRLRTVIVDPGVAMRIL